MAETSKDRLRLWLRVLKATRAVESEIRENLRRDFSTTLPRFDVMAAMVQHEDELKMNQFSDVLTISNGNMTSPIAHTYQALHAKREPDPGDRRARLVRMTEQGRAEFARQAEAHEAWIDKMFADVPPEAAQTMAEALDAVARRLENKDERR